MWDIKVTEMDLLTALVQYASTMGVMKLKAEWVMEIFDTFQNRKYSRMQTCINCQLY